MPFLTIFLIPVSFYHEFDQRLLVWPAQSEAQDSSEMFIYEIIVAYTQFYSFEIFLSVCVKEEFLRAWLRESWGEEKTVNLLLAPTFARPRSGKRFPLAPTRRKTNSMI